MRIQQIDAPKHQRSSSLSGLANAYPYRLLRITFVVLGGFGLFSLGFAAGRLTAGPQTEVISPADGRQASTEISYPILDAPGSDIPDLPRFPGATRVEYRQVVAGDLLETEIEYVMTEELEDVYSYYRRLFSDEGWSVADLGVHQGEWTFFIIKGEREAVVELESRESLTEVEIEVTEPTMSQSPTAPSP